MNKHRVGDKFKIKFEDIAFYFNESDDKYISQIGTSSSTKLQDQIDVDTQRMGYELPSSERKSKKEVEEKPVDVYREDLVVCDISQDTRCFYNSMSDNKAVKEAIEQRIQGDDQERLKKKGDKSIGNVVSLLIESFPE